MRLLGLLSLAFLCACSIGLTREGEAVRLVSDKEREQCKFIGVVAGSMSAGASTAHDAESAMNEVRNKAAQIGANGLRVLGINSNVAASTVTAEALRCD